MEQLPPGYRFLRIVLILGAVGFGLLGVFYVAGGQLVPGLFALFVAGIEAAAIPLLRKFSAMTQARPPDDNGPTS